MSQPQETKIGAYSKATPCILYRSDVMTLFVSTCLFQGAVEDEDANRDSICASKLIPILGPLHDQADRLTHNAAETNVAHFGLLIAAGTAGSC